MEENTATLRTFSNDKYDAMEANILYVEKDKHILKKRKTHNNKPILLLIIALLTVIVLWLSCCNTYTTTEDSKYSEHRSLYQNYNVDELQEYDVNPPTTALSSDALQPQPQPKPKTTSVNIEGFHPYSPTVTMEELYNDYSSIKTKNLNNEQYKNKYYKLVELCVPQLRRRGINYK